MIGQTVSHYKIVTKLGEGGMGVVYKAQDTKLDRPVALKFLPPELTRDPDAKQRFVHEAKAASALQHNNICAIHEIDETEDGRMFICMDYYEGATLRQKTVDGPLPVDEAMDFAVQAAEGLAKAHQAGMVHRDIKSANLIATTDGVIKIVDFGLAKLAGQTRVTMTGTTVGTVAYMSPEQARGGDIDHRTDIWALGVVLYEMLAGQLLFRSDHAHAVTFQILHESPSPITALRAGIPMELERIVNRCLEKNPCDRYQHARELVEELRKVSGGPTPPPKPRKQAIKRAAVVVTVLTVAAIVWQLQRQFRTVPPAKEISVAVVDFQDLGNPDDVARSAGLTSLVNVGLVESAPCRIVSPHLLYELRRRLFGSGRGPIHDDQFLEVARESGAAMMLSGQMVRSGTELYTTWQLADIETGINLGAGRVEGENLAAHADQIIAGALPFTSASSRTPSSLILLLRWPTTASAAFCCSKTRSAKRCETMRRKPGRIGTA